MSHCLTERSWLSECETAICFPQFWLSRGHISLHFFTLTLPPSPNRLAYCARLPVTGKPRHNTLAQQHTSSRSMLYSDLLERDHLTYTFTPGCFFYHHCCRDKKVVLFPYMGGWVDIGKHLWNSAAQWNIIAWVYNRGTPFSFQLVPLSVLFTIYIYIYINYWTNKIS